MSETTAIAIVGVGAILPDAPDAQTFWKNIQSARYSITEVAADRWDPSLFYSPDHAALDKTYSKIGGWVRGFKFEPARMGIAIPPRIQEQIDEAQQWAISACYQALNDYGYPSRFLDPDRVAVILGNAMAGEKHYLSTIRIHLPEYIQALSASPAFQNLTGDVQASLIQGLSSGVRSMVPPITEDTMPGELSNIIAGRVANVFNFTGPNFVTDAACASSLAALQSAVDGLRFGQFDAVLTGGVDRNMGVESFVKFSKIGALSPDGSRPYAEGANGFVMGEGAAILLLKRLIDAERDGDKIYAVIRAIGGSSDGKGKGITAPNPLGQQRAIQRAWKNAAIPLSSVGLIEGHGTSTPVGDLAEVNSLNAIFGNADIRPGSVALGSVKSNFGHLKSSAGAAGLLKTALALYDHVLPPSVNFDQPNTKIDFSQSPFYVNTRTHAWEVPSGEVRRAGVSAFGFGGTNFHVVMEEYLPGVLTKESSVFPGVDLQAVAQTIPALAMPADLKPYRGLLFLGASSAAELSASLANILHQAKLGHLPENICPTSAQLGLPERLVIDYENLREFITRTEKALKALETDAPAGWQALGVQGVYRGSGRPGKLAFLFPGQGSQYVNMLRDLRAVEPLVAETFRAADAVMAPILGRPISSYVFVDGKEDAITQAELRLRSTDITQPALLAVHVSILRVLEKYGFKPDMVIGHSLGEYAALVAAGVLSLTEALQVVSARGQEMSKVAADDNGCMAAVSAPLAEVERILKTIPGYVVIANLNSPVQCVIGGATASVEASIAAFLAEGLQATKIPVSHAFHTRIVGPASQPLRKVIARMNVQTPRIPIVANVTGESYPTEVEGILDILAAQVASPVQFVKGVNTLYEQGARVFVEVGPKRVLSGLVTDILKEHKDVTVLSTNHPRKGDIPSINEALGRLYAAGASGPAASLPVEVAHAPVVEITTNNSGPELVSAHMDAEPASTQSQAVPSAHQGVPMDGRLPLTGSVVISGAGLGLPGRTKHVFDDNNILDILNGSMRIEALPVETRQGMLDKHPTRLVKSDAGAIMQPIDDMELTLKLAGQRGTFDPASEFGLPKDRLEAIDISTQLAIAAGIEALRDAGIPLVMAYKPTSTGSTLPDRWKLPERLADETGVIFASAFPGLDRMADESEKFYQSQALLKQIEELRSMARLIPAGQADLKTSFENRISELEAEAARLDYHFDRRYVFRVLTMGHSQFAEYIGARGPNTHVNAACASTTHAIAIAEDWIRLGRARRVVIVAGDDVISGSLSQWIGTSLMATGAATPEGNLRLAALPFDRRRNGMIIGMAAAGLVVESEDAVRERGMRAICEVLSTNIANSAYHGTRLNVDHVSQVMENLLKTAESRYGISRSQIAAETMFVSHETYTPARGGSAAAEIHALRSAFGAQANQVIIANTKGFTGHTMGVGVEDVVAVKALEYGLVPPIANIQEGFEPDPELGDLNLSRGGKYPVQYSLRLGAGFGSQIAMTLLRKVAGQGERMDQSTYDRWLSEVSGYASAELEVTQRTLRIQNQGAPVQKPAASRWQYGQGPTLWAAASQNKLSQPDSPTAAPSQDPAEPQVATTWTLAAAASSPLPTEVRGTAIADPEAIKTFVLAAVSEKTGYPTEVLDLDLDLEADLGIDTVKQAELFAAIRENYAIPRREDLRLSDYNTLAKTIAFVKDSLSSGASSPTTPAVAASAEPISTAALSSPLPTEVRGTAIADPEAIKTFVLAAVSEKTGYPTEVLDLDLDLEADLGIDTVKQAELFAAIRENYAIPRREDLRLSDYNTLAKTIAFVKDSLSSGTSSPTTPEVAAAAEPISTAALSSPLPTEVRGAANADPEAIKAFVLAAVSEKTGYPTEVLELDLDLEADLGIDTVKQAELFAAIRENYAIPRREDLRLSDYNTLAKTIAFVRDSLSSGTSSPTAPTVAASAEPISTAALSNPLPTEVRGTAIADPEAIKTFVLAAVSEKTGYPTEVLDLDLDLEADLGIDTVKQAELFAAIRENYAIPRREDLRLSDYNTLAKTIAFVRDSLAPTPAPSPAVTEPPDASPEINLTEAVATPLPPPASPDAIPEQAPVASAEAEVNSSIIRRIPVPSLRPRLDLCIPTGVELAEGARVLLVETHTRTGNALAKKLAARNVAVLRLGARLQAEQILAKLTDWLAEGPIAGVYFLPAIEVEPGLAEMDITAWQSGLEERLYSLYTIMKALPEETFLVCATRLGGLHGYSTTGASAPLGGATSGFAKAVAREREKAFIKVVDFETNATPDVIAARLIGETLQDPGALEIGWEAGLRYGIATVEEPLPTEPNFSLEQGSVFLISGGSGGIIRPIVEDLARATHGTFYLLDRVPLPDANDPDIQRLASDREGLKTDLISRLTREGKKPTPVQVEAALFAIERSATTLQTLHIIEELGGQAHYLACDVTDPGLIDAAIQQVKDAEGHIDAFLHAAGMERSRKLEMKPPEEFRLVVSVKANGFFNLFKAMEAKGILPRGLLFFSSVAGRFGNSGQTDYAAANDLLCKVASALRNQYSGTKAVVIDWSAWGGVGMATRGNIPTLMKMAGIDMIPPEEAAPMVRLELLASRGEAIIAGSLGALLEEHSPHAGMDLVKADAALRSGQPIHSMLSHVTDFDLNRGLTLEAELDPKTEPFLYDHTLNGTPVLPGVMGIEGFSVAAKHIGSVLASAQGGLEVASLEDIQFLAAFKFYRKEPRRVTWIAQAVRQSQGLVVTVTLESCRTLKTGADEHMRHFSGRVILKPPAADAQEINVPAPAWNGNYTVKAQDIYRLYFHGPAFQVLEGVQRSGSTLIGKLNKELPSILNTEHALLSTPTLVELCFQTAGIWEIGATGVMALPRAIESLTLHRQTVNGAAIYAEVQPSASPNGELHFDARVVDSKGHLYLELKNYRTSPLPHAVEPGLLEPLQELMKD
jgi:malonyl CoA-acyl carrier protein transacylase